MASLVSRFLGMFSGTGRTPGYQLGVPLSGKLTNRTVTSDTAMQMSVVFACVRVIAEAIASMPCKFYDTTGDFPKQTKDLILAKLLSDKPNRYQTGVEFFETMVMQWVLHGNAYAKITRSGDRVIALLPLMSQQMTVQLDDKGNVLYQYTDGKDIAYYAPESIWHLKLMGNGVIGLSPLDYARNSIGIAISAEDRVSTIANNGFKPAGVLTIDKVLKPEQRAAIRQNFADLAEGGDESLRVLEAGMNYQQISMSPKDVQLLETRQFQREDISPFFGIPYEMLKDKDALSSFGFYKMVLRPYLEKMESSIKSNLLTNNERVRYRAEFDYDELIRMSEKERYATYKEAIQGGVAKPNDCRKREGLEPVEGGDIVYMQSQMTPLKNIAEGATVKGML